MYLVAILSQLFAVLMLAILWLATDWRAGVKVAVALPLIAVFSLVALSVSKGIWVAVEYLTDVYTGKTGDEDYEARAFEDGPRR